MMSYSSIFKCMTESGMPKRWLSVTRRLSIWMNVAPEVLLFDRPVRRQRAVR